MSNIVGSGIARTLIDQDGDSIIDATANALKVVLVDSGSIDIGDVEITGHSTITSGSNTDIDSGDDEVLGASAACKHIDIQAITTNAGIVYVGSENVTSATGIALHAGDVYSIDIDDVDNVFVRASIDNQAVSYVYYN